MCVSSVCMCKWGPIEARRGAPETGVTGAREPPNVGAGS